MAFHISLSIRHTPSYRVRRQYRWASDSGFSAALGYRRISLSASHDPDPLPDPDISWDVCFCPPGKASVPSCAKRPTIQWVATLRYRMIRGLGAHWPLDRVEAFTAYLAFNKTTHWILISLQEGLLAIFAHFLPFPTIWDLAGWFTCRLSG